MTSLRLGVNIDHVATLRNARGGSHPDPLAAALAAQAAGADGITAHLREDRRHITDSDIFLIKKAIRIPLNFEMAATDEMLAIALELRPNAVCLVPERRAELTTEGGLAVAGNEERLREISGQLKAAGVRVSLFVDAQDAELAASAAVGADIVELHTGPYCEQPAGLRRDRALTRLRTAAEQASRLGLEVHAGHGLSFDTVGAVAALTQMAELNIGHFIISQSVFDGLDNVIAKMRQLMADARI